MTITSPPILNTISDQQQPNSRQRIVDLSTGAWPARYALQRYEEHLISADNCGDGWGSYLSGTLGRYPAGGLNVEVVDGIEYVADGSHDETGWRVPVALDWVTVGIYDDPPLGAVR